MPCYLFIIINFLLIEWINIEIIIECEMLINILLINVSRFLSGLSQSSTFFNELPQTIECLNNSYSNGEKHVLLDNTTQHVH